MSLSSNEMSPADIAAITGNNNNSMWGNDGMMYWFILFFFFMYGGWGNGYGYGNGGPSGSMGSEVQRGFDQQAIMGNFSSLGGQLNSMVMQQQNCCCENRQAIGDLRYSIATEACADRQAVNDGVRDIIANQTAGIQTILDKLCQQEIDALKTQNANLQTQINLANLQASQTAQTSRILQDNAAQTLALEQYLNPAPVPAYVVQNPNCCNQNFGCGCGAI